MINVSETIEDNALYFTVNFEENITENQILKIESFWSENKQFFDEKHIDVNYLLLKVTNLVNSNSIHNIRRIVSGLTHVLKELENNLNPDFSFEYNRPLDLYNLKSYLMVCPRGYKEENGQCIPDSDGHISQSKVCPIGNKWNEKHQCCLPEHEIPNTPLNYYWDFESATLLPISKFKYAVLKSSIKNSEVEYYRVHNQWDLIELTAIDLKIDANISNEMIETFIFNFYQGKWRECKTKVYIEIGKSLRDNYSQVLDSVYESDGYLMIKLKEKNETSTELLVELRSQLQFYWNKLIETIDYSDFKPLIMNNKNDKLILKLEDESSIIVPKSSVDLLRD